MQFFLDRISPKFTHSYTKQMIIGNDINISKYIYYNLQRLTVYRFIAMSND